jgi:predicted secreted Zn-dependent protease
MAMIRELQIPTEIEGDENATEMIRVWLAHEDVHVSLLLGMWEDAADSDVDEAEAWGNLLADVSRHVANGMQQSHGWAKLETLRKIRQAFLENLELQERRIEGKYLAN